MNALERRHYSIGGKTFRAIVLYSLMISIAAGTFGVLLYGSAVNREYRVKTWHGARAAAEVLDIAEIRRQADIAVSVYDSLSEEERTGDPSAYLDKYAEVRKGNFTVERLKLHKIMEANEDVAAYVAFLDVDKNRMVYIMDSDMTSHFCEPGTWDEMKPEWMSGYVNGVSHFLDGLYGIGRMTSITYRMEKYGYRASSGVEMYRVGSYPVMVFCEADMNQVTAVSISFLWQYALLLLIVALIVLAFAIHTMNKSVVLPINALAGAARAYSQDRSVGQTGTSHFAGVDITTGDEIENLSLTMKAMEHDLAEYVKDLTRITAEKERVNTELSLARRIQTEMLPNIFPAFPERKEFNIYARMNPAKEVGGDFYDFFFTDQDHLAMVIADVSGKGVPAAMFMTMAKTMLQTQAISGGTPKDILKEVNDIVCANNRESLFVTVWLGIVDLKTGILTAANAGHEYPALKPPDGTFEIIQDKHGFVVGGIKGAKYSDYELKLRPGSKLFVYTDGVTEAQNSRKEMFGLDRTVCALNRAADDTPEGIIVKVRGEIQDFMGEAEQFDDITMLSFEYLGTEEQEQ